MAPSVQRPKSVEEIVKDAQTFECKTQYPLRIALRTAQNILHQAANCLRHGNIQDAYLFLYRHAEFCMSQIAAHPDRRLPEFKGAVVKATKEVQAGLKRLEELKPEIARRYERYQESLMRIEAARDRERQLRASDLGPSARRASLDLSANDDARIQGSSKVITAGEHSDLALRLAERDRRRRREVDGASEKHREQREFAKLAQNIRDLGRTLDRRDNIVEDGNGSSAQVAYPGIRTHDVLSSEESAPSYFHAPPSLPPKAALSSISAPALPPKTSNDNDVPGESLESTDYTFKTLAKTEAGEPLRSLFIPSELRSRFLSIADSNTRGNLETCGILCGSLISNALFISHLVIPEQIATSDTCDTTEAGDNALFDYVDGQELMVCGWIHTHPTQTCFLSSRDLHTSVGYQVMLPESVAIVCAPSRNPDYGIFRLTDPPGKQAILACTKQGLFHPHEQSNLYTDAISPGHVRELKGLQFQVVDLRKG